MIKVTELDPGEALESEVMIVRIAAEPDRRGAVSDTAALFAAKVTDVGPHSITFEASGTPQHLASFLEQMKPYGIVDLVKSGSYPRSLKRRILSPLGHLSNDALADFLASADMRSVAWESLATSVVRNTLWKRSWHGMDARSISEARTFNAVTGDLATMVAVRSLLAMNPISPKQSPRVSRSTSCWPFLTSTSPATIT